MQINLLQKDIEAALRQYIGQQGINLSGKTVTIDFTAGRKPQSLSASVSIDDATVSANLITSTTIPTDTLVAATQPVTLVETKTYDDGTKATGTVPLPAASPAEQEASAAPTETTASPVAAETEVGAAEVVTEVKPTTSLFSSN